MASNIFNEWPLWHWFTLHAQNIVHVTEAFKEFYFSSGPILLSTINDSSDTTHRVISKILQKHVVYDYMSDKIIRLGDLSKDMQSRVYIVSGIYNLTQAFLANLDNKDRYIIQKDDIIKKGSTITGSRVLKPMITPIPIFNSWYKYANGVIGKKDVAAELQKLRQGGIDGPDIISGIIDENPIYQDVWIKYILEIRDNIHKQCKANVKTKDIVSAPNLEKQKANIRKILNTNINPSDAINISTGKKVTKNADTYNIQVFKFVIENTTKEVKFAFVNTMKSTERDNYIRILREEFNAQNVIGSEPDNVYKKSINLAQKAVIDASEYQTIMSTVDGFIEYTRNMNKLTAIPADITSNVASTYAIQNEEPDEEDDEVDDEITEDDDGDL